MKLPYKIRKSILFVLNMIMAPFAIVRIRLIQYRYKRITTRNYTERSNVRIATLILLQCKEYYYERMFDSWGRFHPSFSYTSIGLIKHIRFMRWLFPEKDFEEWDNVVYHNPRAVTFYQNEIYTLNKYTSTPTDKRILVQIKKWKDEEFQRAGRLDRSKHKKHLVK